MATIHQSRNLRYMVAELEDTPGTMEAPETANFIHRIRDINIAPTIAFDDENAKHANGNHAETEAIAGEQSIQITCNIPMYYSGVVTTVPNWWTLAKFCGLGGIGWDGGSAVAEGSAVEGMSLVNRKLYDDVTATIWIYDVTIGSTPITTIYKAKGCMGNMVIDGALGRPAVANFTFTGALADIVDGAAIAPSAPQTTLADPFLSSAFTIGGVAEKVSSWQLDLGNEITPIWDQSDATGILHYARTNTRPRFSCNPLGVKQATTDWLNEILSETTQPISCPIGANMTVKGIDAQLLNPAIAEREGLVNWDLNMRLLANGVAGTPADAALTLEDTLTILQGARS